MEGQEGELLSQADPAEVPNKPSRKAAISVSPNVVFCELFQAPDVVVYVLTALFSPRFSVR